MKRILIVEDDNDIRELLKQCLSEEFPSAGIVTACNGAEGLLKTRDSDFDVILSDINMPVMNGMDFLAELRKSKNYTPFIILTAHGDLPMTVMALRQGAIDFIHKPFDMERVFRAISRCLNEPNVESYYNAAIEDLKTKNALTTEQIDKLERMNQYVSNLRRKA